VIEKSENKKTIKVMKIYTGQQQGRKRIKYGKNVARV
jgi:hypothetical protein